MLDQLIQIDHLVFDFINQNLSNSFFDSIMPIIRNKKTWFPFYLLTAVLLIKFKKKEGFLIMALALLCIGLADGISSHLMKPYFERIRPCYLPHFADHVNLVVERCSGAFSFPSSHAANHFALGGFLALVFSQSKKYLSFILITWASAICFAQVYVGVHFPFDVLVGAILGLLIALIVHQVFIQLKMKFLK